MVVRTIPTLCLLLIVVWSGAPVLGADDPIDPKLEGAWKITRIERPESDDDDRGTLLLFKGNKLTFKHAKGEVASCKVRINPKETPRQIDWLFRGEGDDFDSKYPGIYEIKDDKLRISFTESDLFPLCVLRAIVNNESEVVPRPSSFTEKKTIRIFAERVGVEGK